MNMKLGLGAALLAASLLVGGTASAATVINLANNLPAGTTGEPLTVTCTATCFGYVGTVGLFTTSATDADAYEYSPDNEATIAAQFSALLGLSPANAIIAGDVDKTNVPEGDNGENFSFNVTAGYFFVKYGDWTSFLLAETDQEVTFFKGPRGPAGLSNYGTIDGYDDNNSTGPVPLPAGLPLMLAGIGAMAFLARRKARKA